MSKLEEQKALPRRKLFRPQDKLGRVLFGGLDPIAEFVPPKRKAKKAKGKR